MASGKIACLCGSIDLPLAKSLPGRTELCHCNPCRHTSGALFAGWVGPLDGPPDADTLAKCTVYHSSKTHDRYFCSTCGTKTFISCHSWSDGSERGEWHVFGGAIDPPSGVENVLDVETNEWLTDAGDDGGMAPFLTKLAGGDIPCYEVDRKSKQLSSNELNEMMQKSASLPLPRLNETVKAECRCGGVSMCIQRANHEDRSISQLDRFIAKDSEGKPTNKHMAFYCVCRSCRLGTGVSLTPFLYIPPVQVINPHTNKPVAQHREVGTEAGREANKGLSLTHYWSSKDSCRSFCSVCGASAFYSYEKRQEIVNVAAGLLRAEEGVMGRRWFSWQEESDSRVEMSCPVMV